MDRPDDALSIARLRPYRPRRSSSFDRSGGNADYVNFGAGETFTLLDVDGPGVVRHIWITIDCKKNDLYRKDLVLRVYYDGQDQPSVESPIGDFFGNGWGETYNFNSPWLACAPREGRALVCYFPMPFRRHARVTVENQGGEPVEHFYFYVDYDEVPSIDEDVAYFHAWYNQELTKAETPEGVENEWAILTNYGNNPSDENNYLWLETQGQGHFVGVNYYVSNPGPIWYGEGDDMWMIDGEPWPGLHGTGTEDYLNTAWSPDVEFESRYFGCAKAPGVRRDGPPLGWMGRTHVWRFHELDPVRFQNSLRVSIEHGHANCLCMELASVSYWYQTLPTPAFPTLADLKERHPRPVPTEVDIHLWRDAYMREHKLQRLWNRRPQKD